MSRKSFRGMRFEQRSSFGTQCAFPCSQETREFSHANHSHTDKAPEICAKLLATISHLALRAHAVPPRTLVPRVAVAVRQKKRDKQVGELSQQAKPIQTRKSRIHSRISKWVKVARLLVGFATLNRPKRFFWKQFYWGLSDLNREPRDSVPRRFPGGLDFPIALGMTRSGGGRQVSTPSPKGLARDCRARRGEGRFPRL